MRGKEEEGMREEEEWAERGGEGVPGEGGPETRSLRPSEMPGLSPRGEAEGEWE